MFSHSFVLDIYGNPTTLGCQMAIKPELPLEHAKGSSRNTDFSHATGEMVEDKPV